MINGIFSDLRVIGFHILRVAFGGICEIVVHRQPICIGGQLTPSFLSEIGKHCPSSFPQRGQVVLSKVAKKIYVLMLVLLYW